MEAGDDGYFTPVCAVFITTPAKPSRPAVARVLHVRKQPERWMELRWWPDASRRKSSQKRQGKKNVCMNDAQVYRAWRYHLCVEVAGWGWVSSACGSRRSTL